jgi:hypothetical protein
VEFRCWSCGFILRVTLGDINTETWPSGMGVGRGANNPTL